jgi:hypothetical protein
VNSSTTEAGVPRLSAIVASFSAGPILAQCLDALTAGADPIAVEIVVVRDVARIDGFDGAAARQRYPHVTFIDAPEGTTVPHLRTLGIAACRAGVIALLEDDCVVEPGWTEAAMSMAASPHVAIGGAVEPGPYARGLDWAVYFCEYGRFMLPVNGGSPPLPGNNAVYKRSALVDRPSADGFQEVFAQAEWRRRGVTTGASDALVVRNINRWPMRQLTAVPFHHARAYASRRFAGRPLAVRLPLAAMMVALPVVKVVRLFAETSNRGRLMGRLIRSLPWVFLFTASWSAGEMTGCLAGPGRSAGRWR